MLFSTTLSKSLKAQLVLWQCDSTRRPRQPHTARTRPVPPAEVQLTLEQHGFELHWFSYMQIFFNEYTVSPSYQPAVDQK